MQEVLRDSWLTAREGTLCAREQARAWALREIWIETNVQRKVARSKLSRTDLYGMIAFVRNRVLVTGKTTHHPSTQSLADLFHKIDSDSGWFPGKKGVGAAPPGPELSHPTPPYPTLPHPTPDKHFRLDPDSV